VNGNEEGAGRRIKSQRRGTGLLVTQDCRSSPILYCGIDKLMIQLSNPGTKTSLPLACKTHRKGPFDLDIMQRLWHSLHDVPPA
jgi:hypothetical protein